MSSNLSVLHLVASHTEILESLLIIFEFVLMSLGLMKKAGFVSTWKEPFIENSPCKVGRDLQKSTSPVSCSEQGLCCS